MTEVSFGEWLKRQRSGRGLTQEQLAQQIGCAVVTLRKIEAEERRPSAQMIERMAEILKIPPDERTNFLRYARGDLSYAPTERMGEAPWRVSTVSPRSNLPAPPSSLIGRAQEIALVCEYLSDNHIRLVTLIGPPGIGKTRLSIESARQSLADFPDGVFFVALAPLENPGLVAQTITQTLSFVEINDRSPLERLKDGIGNKQMLLVLDNCEHLIEDVASLASALLSACSRLKILTTSRESLRIPGEWLYSVPTFEFPDISSKVDVEIAQQFPALALFTERARAVRSDFALNADNIQTVTAICAHLDGLPLAIELIAARMRLMSPQALLERLNDQFILSVDGMRAATERQRTLNNAIGWSYDLLSAEEQKMFAYLSVFSGGFTLDAAEAIFSPIVTAKSVADLIALLLDKSLLQRVLTEHGEARFDMLVTIQEYAQDRLRGMGEETEARNWHLEYFSELARQARPHLRSTEQVAWLDRLETEHDNIRAALAWAPASGSIANGLHLATDLEQFWISRAYLREPCLVLENFLAASLPPDEIHALAKGYLLAGLLRMFLGDLDVAYAHAEECERLCLQIGPTSKVELADARNLLVYTGVNFINDPIRSREALEQNLKLFQDAGDRWKIAHTIFNIGHTLRQIGDFIGARQAFEQSLALFSECGDHFRVSKQNAALAGIDFEEGKYAYARQRLEEVISFNRQVRYKIEMDVALYQLGAIAICEGNYARAKAWYSECLLFDQQIGVHTQFAECLLGFASIANAENDFERAARLVGAAEMEVEARQIPLENFDRAELQRLTSVLREELDDEKFEALTAEGRAMTMEQAVEYALENQK